MRSWRETRDGEYETILPDEGPEARSHSSRMNAADKRPIRFVPGQPLPQLVPSRVCLSCEVCCRFPDPDSFLRPFFTQEEIAAAVEHGMAPGHFSDSTGCQISVVAHPHGEGHLCPAFDAETSHCRIYEVRPLDCQIYPFTLMWNADHTAVVLGWDQKCPFMMTEASTGIETPQLTHDAQAYASRIQERFEREETLLDLVARNPKLVTPYQEDVVVVGKLVRLTAAIASKP